MKMFKSLINLSISAVAAAAFILPSPCFAEGDGKQDWAEKAALEYEQKAELAVKNGKEKDALIYLRMAQIKREAGNAAKAGKPFSWDEYHQLNGMLQHSDKHADKKTHDHKDKPDGRKEKAHNPKKGDGKQPDRKNKHKDKPKPDHSHKKHAEDAGDEFIKTSEQYEHKSLAALKDGDTQKAMTFIELASIKRQAAAALNQGKDFDWTRYHELLKQLEE